MLHTPTQMVPPETLATFAATDFPFLIVVDHAGIVRFLDVAPEAALQTGGFVDTVVEDAPRGGRRLLTRSREKMWV